MLRDPAEVFFYHSEACNIFRHHGNEVRRHEAGSYEAVSPDMLGEARLLLHFDCSKKLVFLLPDEGGGEMIRTDYQDQRECDRSSGTAVSACSRAFVCEELFWCAWKYSPKVS